MGSRTPPPDSRLVDEIIVPVDGSDESARALIPARTIADHLDVTMRVVLFHPPSADAGEVTDMIEQQVSDTGGGAHTVEVLPAVNPVADHLDAVVEASPSSLVVMSTRGRGHSAALLGSVANEVLAASHRPVLLIGPSCDPANFTIPGRLIVAADKSPGTKTTLTLAAQLLAAFDFDAQVIHVLDAETASALERSRATPAGVDLPHESAMAHRYSQQLHEASGRDIDYGVLHAKHAGPAIAEYAIDQDAALIVMATHARRGLRRLALGSVTSEVVARASCPVLAAVPEHES